MTDQKKRQEDRESMAFRLEQAKAGMKHSIIAGTTKYVNAGLTDIRVTFARIMAEQKPAKARLRNVK